MSSATTATSRRTEYRATHRLALEEYFFLSDNVNYWLGCPASLLRLEAEGNYAKIFIVDGGTIVVRRPLTACADRLPQHLFFRASRYCVINLAHVQKLETFNGKRFQVTLTDGAKIAMSREQSLIFRWTKGF